MPQELQLPDGRILVIPDNITLDQRAALRNKLGDKYADIKTGKGMEQRSQRQAGRTFTGTGEEGSYDVRGRKVAGPSGEPLTLMERAAQEQSGRQATLGERMQRAGRSPTPVTAATAMYAPLPAARSIVGSEVGSRVGGRVAGDYGRLAGGAVGGVVGAMPGPSNLAQRVLRGPGGSAEVTINPATMATRELEARVPMNEPPGARGEMQMDIGQQQADAIARENLAQRTAARQAARAGKAVPVSTSPGPYRGPGGGGVGVPGTAAQETGYQPPVTRVPIRPTPSSPLTAEQVPGPDTAGKGNLLTPAARRGDPRAAQELMRRGRQVIYTPGEEYPGTRLQGTLSERIRAGAPEPGRSEAATPSLRPEVQEMATSRSYGPEFEGQQRQEMISRYKGILRNQAATEEDRREASARLNEMGALF